MLHRPVYNHLRAIGCLAFAYNPATQTDKLSPRGVPCIFLGYPHNTKGYNLINLLTQTRFISRDVKFHENIFPYNNTTLHSLLQPVPTTTSQTPNLTQYEDCTPIITTNSQTLQTPSSPSPTPTNQSHQTPHAPMRRSTRPTQPPIWMKDYSNTINPTPIANLVVTSISLEFSCFFLASVTNYSRSHKLQRRCQTFLLRWLTAMNEELSSLEKMARGTSQIFQKGRRLLGLSGYTKPNII